MSSLDQQFIDDIQFVLSQADLPPFTDVRALQGDASSRQYFRLFFDDFSLMLMDCRKCPEVLLPFTQITALLAQQKLPVPNIIASIPSKQSNGLSPNALLLEDFGDDTLLGVIQGLYEVDQKKAILESEQEVIQYYRKAISLLVNMQKIPASHLLDLPLYDEKKLRQECAVFPQWFLERFLEITLTPQDLDVISHVFNLLIKNASLQSSCFVHRDYHSRNLMLKADHTVGVIDYQDALLGPIAYDWVSLLKDCYMSLSRKTQLSLLRQGYDMMSKTEALPDWQDFVRDFDWIGLQRHLKVLGVFSRLALRDGKTGYLKDIPRILAYVTETCKAYEVFQPLLPIIQKAEVQFMAKGRMREMA